MAQLKQHLAICVCWPLWGTGLATTMAMSAVGDEARNDYLRGVSAIGNLIFWACDNPNYTDHKADMPALGAFLKHTADMARAAEFMAGHLDALADDKGGDK